MKYKLCDWEDNQYHDSYFYGVYFDDETGKLAREEYGSTAYAGGYNFAALPSPTPKILEHSRLELAAIIYSTIRAAEYRDVLTPQNAERGQWLRLSEAHNSRKTGLKLQLGQRIRVNDCTAFGTFYAKGYNKPNRENRSVIGTLEGHPEICIRVPLAKCRLDREPLTDDQLKERADRLSYNHQYGGAFGCKAWLCHNWAADLAKQLGIVGKELEAA